MDLKLSLAFSIILGQSKQFQQQTREQFFCTKKSCHRNKSSKQTEQDTTLSRNSQTNRNCSQYQIIKILQNLDVKKLHYSLAETEDPDALLEFKKIQPKKKKPHSKIQSTQHEGGGPVDHNQQGISEPIKFRIINKIDNTASQNKQQKQDVLQLCKSQKLEQKRQKLTFYQPKKKISKTLTTLFSTKVTLVQQKQQVGIQINDFEIIKQVGYGTYSKVYQVVHKKSGFLCALKIIQKRLIKQLKVQQNSIRQIKILSCLSAHPNITTLYGSFTDQRNIYLILQLCTDGDVNRKFKKLRETWRSYGVEVQQKRISRQQKQMQLTVTILKQICLALKQLHQHSIMHRDIKPENVLITMGNNVKMSDFGWSVHNPKDNLRRTLCGTPLYLAPQFIITCQYDDSIDIWSLGILAYQIFTNAFPFKIQSAKDLTKIAKQQINFQVIRCPAARDFCRKALAKDCHYRADIWELLQHDIFNLYKTTE